MLSSKRWCDITNNVPFHVYQSMGKLITGQTIHRFITVSLTWNNRVSLQNCPRVWTHLVVNTFSAEMSVSSQIMFYFGPPIPYIFVNILFRWATSSDIKELETLHKRQMYHKVPIPELDNSDAHWILVDLITRITVN